MAIFTIQDPLYSVSDLGFDKALVRSKQTTLESITPELMNVFTNGIAPKNVISGEVISTLEQQVGALFTGKTSFDNTQTGYRLGIDSSDGLAKFYIGNTTNYLNWTGTSLDIVGSITATSGFFGVSPNGISITSAGLEISGTGYIRTSSSGARIELVSNYPNPGQAALVSYKTGSTADLYILSGQDAILSVFGTTGRCASFIQSTVGTFNAVEMSTSTGSTDRTSYAILRMDNDSDTGAMILADVGSANSGEIIKVTGNNTNRRDILVIPQLSWTGSKECRITSEGYIQFPPYYHISDFDEGVADTTALSASIIANQYWTGSGTNGTQTFDVNGSYDSNTPLLIQTGALANSTSQILFKRATDTNVGQCVMEFRFDVTNITNTRFEFGTYTSATSYAILLFDTAVHASNWYFATYTGGAESRTVLSQFPSANTWVTLRIVFRGSSSALIYIDDTLILTYSTAGVPLTKQPYVYINNKAAAENKKIYLDYVKMWYLRSHTTP